MPSEKEAARRAEPLYNGGEDVGNKLDLDEELYRILCKLDRARFLQGLTSPRGSLNPDLALLRQAASDISRARSLILSCSRTRASWAHPLVDSDETEISSTSRICNDVVAGSAESWSEALSGFRALA